MFIMYNPQSVNTQHTTHRRRKIDAKANCNHWSPVLWPFVCQSATEINAGPSDTTGEISTSSSPSFPETPAERIRASKKGKRASKRKAPDNESDDEALKDVRQQGGESSKLLGFFATNTHAAACHNESVYGINCENPWQGTEWEMNFNSRLFLTLERQPSSCSLFMLRIDETELWKQMKVVLTDFFYCEDRK